jgi:hypothetical protein
MICVLCDVVLFVRWYRVGGKYGPERSSVEAAAAGAVESQQEELKRAAGVVASSFASVAVSRNDISS